MFENFMSSWKYINAKSLEFYKIKFFIVYVYANLKTQKKKSQPSWLFLYIALFLLDAYNFMNTILFF